MFDNDSIMHLFLFNDLLNTFFLMAVNYLTTHSTHFYHVRQKYFYKEKTTKPITLTCCV